MKFVVALVLSTFAFSALAQKHMVQFGTDANTIGNLSWQSEKNRGSDSEETKSYFLLANYAYSLTNHIQVGGKVAYYNYKYAWASYEEIGFAVGGYYNLDTNFRKSIYASAFIGMDWGRETHPNSSTEVLNASVAVGKRFPLSFVGLENVTYSPEVAFVSKNPTKSSSTEWTQGLEFRIVQFSVFF